MSKMNVGVIGTGNIGTDLLIKLNRSRNLNCTIFAGRNQYSQGLKYAQSLGVNTTFDSIEYIEENPDCCDIVFDATSASVHRQNSIILKKLKKFTIDLTPANVGEFCVPSVNLEQGIECDNVNMVTCGGQATIPIVHAIVNSVDKVNYLEIVASIASKSAGLGTRNNIDEFTQTTSDALRKFTGIEKTKAIIILNPAEPPITMQNTIYACVENPDMTAIVNNVKKMEKRIQKYVPGYKIVLGPIYENGRITITVKVIGSGDYLPKYSGNLDIITCAAIEIAEEYARRKGYKGE